MTRAQAKVTIPTPSQRGKTRGSKKTQSQPSTRVTVPERGFVLTSEKHGEVEEWLNTAISNMGWEVFVEPPEQACSEFVAAFLSAYVAEEYPYVLIKGTKVSFTEEDINDAYNLAVVPPEEDDFENYCKRRSDEEATNEVLRVICQEGAQWEKGESLLRKNLKFEAKVWMHFINSRMIPGSHDTRVTWERAVLVFCILAKKKFDVGRLVSNQLAANMGRKSPFYFPCLVTEMCRSAGLKPENPDLMEVIPLGSVIDQGTLKRMRDNEGVEGEGEAEREEGQEEEEEKTETVDGASENVKNEEPQSTSKAAPFPKVRKTTAGRNRRPEEGAAPGAGGLSLWAQGAEALSQQVQNIEHMIRKELNDVKTASLLIATEKENLEHELEKLKNEEPAAKKRKMEPSEQQQFEEVLKGLNDTVITLKQELNKREQEHKEEKHSWSEEIQALRSEQGGMKIMLLQLFKYIRDRDAVADSNWAGKFKGQPRFPPFPDILPPEAITNAPDEGASFLGEQ